MPPSGWADRAGNVSIVRAAALAAPVLFGVRASTWSDAPCRIGESRASPEEPAFCGFGSPAADGCATITDVIRAELGLGILGTALWIYCLLDVIMADEHRIRNLPKLTWVMIVLFTYEIGAVAWLVAGRPQSAPRSLPYKGNTGSPYPEYDRPGRFVATNPDDDEAFLRQVRERAEAQRQEAKRQREAREAREQAERKQAEREQARKRSEADPTAGDPGPGQSS